MKGFDPKHLAIVDKRFEKELGSFKSSADTAGSIVLTKYKPNYLSYHSNNKTEQLAVFSEIYYEKGWDAYIDGKLAPYLRTNYVLRAMVIPAGEHTVEFKFQPVMFKVGKIVDLACSLTLILLAIGIIGVELYRLGCLKKNQLS